MKVLFIAAFPPPVHGSALISEYLVKLIEPKFDVISISLGSKDVLSSYNSSRLKKLIKGILRLIQIVLTMPRNCDIVYFTPALNGLPFWRDMVILLFINMKNPTASVLLHMHNKGLEKSRKKRKVFNHLSCNATIIALTKKLAYPYSGQVRVINNFTINDPDITFKRKENVSRVGYLSNYILDKGIRTFVDIAFDLKHTPLEFEAVGNDADCTRENLLEIIKNNKQTNIKILGPKYDQDKWRFIDRLDILLFPSTYSNECSPLVLLEAMSRGVLVISFNEGGVEDMLPKNSLCLVSNKPQMLNVLNKLIDNPELFNKERLAQKLFFDSKFTEKKFKTQMIDLFLEINRQKPT